MIDDYEFSCALCNHRSREQALLHDHIELHRLGNYFRCLECDFVSDEQMQLLLHSQNGCSLYRCTNCDYKCADRTDFVDHMELHMPDIKCPFCTLTTVSEADLLAHFRRKHVTLDELNCDSCGFITSSVSDYVNHLRRHSNDYPFKCSLCYFRSHCKDMLMDHLFTHGFELRKCNNCYIKCICSATADQERPYTCSICFYKFTRRANMFRHLRLHKSAEHLQSDSRMYCDTCGFGTSIKVRLINHMKTHRLHN